MKKRWGRRRVRGALNVRLMAVLLVVTIAGLGILTLVSCLALDRYLSGKLNSELVTTADLVASAKVGPARLNNGKFLKQGGVVPTRFDVLSVDAATDTVRELTVSAETEKAKGRLTQLLQTNPNRLGQLTRNKRPFALGPGLRAFARTRTVKGSGVSTLVTVVSTDEIDKTVFNTARTELATGLGLIVLVALGGWWAVGRGLFPLRAMADTAERIARGGDLTARMPGSEDTTEVGRLATTINVMLDRIETAFTARSRAEEKVREFAADASHELRTPLTTIRGYAELYRAGAIGPDDLPDAMRRIEQEAGRMTQMVGELLELARLDRAGTLQLSPVDIAALARDAVADARAVEPDRPIELYGAPTLFAVVDEPRIRQVLANLLANVRTHTPAGTPASVSVTREGGLVVLEIADAGPGMSAENAARAFDRFHRASRGGTGSGLGLSIIQAIANAHGGQAMLQSTPGRGTVVRIELPYRDQP